VSAFPAFHAGPRPQGHTGPLALVRDAGVRDTLALLLLAKNLWWNDPEVHRAVDSNWHTHGQAASMAVRRVSNATARVLVLEDGSALVEDVARARLLPVPFTIRPHAEPPKDIDVLAAAELWVAMLGDQRIGWSTGCLSPQTAAYAPDGLWLDGNNPGHALPKGEPTPFFQAVQGLALVLWKAHKGPAFAHLSLDMGIPAARGGWYKAPRLAMGFFVHDSTNALHPQHAAALKLFVAECMAHFGAQALCGWRWEHTYPLPEAKPLKVPVKAWEGHVYHDLGLLEHVPSSAHAEIACLGTFLQAAPRSCAALQWEST
jgi:hypothetical protein